jgi:hypothetical protein
LWPVGAEMITPAGMVGVEDKANAPTVESCIAEELIARGGAAEDTRGRRR